MELFRNSSLPPRERAKDLLSRMTIAEKVGQLNQRLYGFGIYERDNENFRFTEEFEKELNRWDGLGVLYGLFRADPWSARTVENGIPARLAAKAYNLVQKRVIEASRFGIPTLMSTECPHGHQALDGYLLPVCLAMGATFATDLVKSGFNVVGDQVSLQGADLALVSVLDVLRDPRWGRSEECFGEDPYLCSVMADAVVSGCIDSGVDVVAKHFCAQGEATGGLNAAPASIGDRELREIHFPPTKAAVKAGTVGIMAAYNEIDGVPCHANSKLLRKILRDEWGFEGIVMADGTAVDRLDGLTDDNTMSGALALRSGVDVSLWDEGFTKLEDAVRRGFVDEAVLDEATLRVLTLKFERGLFESPYLDEDAPAKIFSIDEYPQSLELARQGVVLLKNEKNMLPLKASGKKIAVIGPAADDVYLQLGDYTPPVEPEIGITLWEGLRQTVSSDVELVRAIGCGIREGTREEFDEAISLAKSSDIVILALGGSSSRYSGAKFDINGAAIHDGDVYMDCGEGVDSASLSLPGRQHDLAKAVFATGTPTATIVTAGRPYAIPDIDSETDALIYAFYPGPWGGKALAEILLGITNPSGRLPASLPYSSGQLPCYYNRKVFNANVQYCDLPSTPLYQFGYGLSYTSFTIDNVRVDVENDLSVKVTFDLCNSGNYAGYAVPMLYVRRLKGNTTPREKELKAFLKVWLEVGQQESVVLKLDKESLSCPEGRGHSLFDLKSIMLMLEEGGVEYWRSLP